MCHSGIVADDGIREVINGPKVRAAPSKPAPTPTDSIATLTHGLTDRLTDVTDRRTSIFWGPPMQKPLRGKKYRHKTF